MELSDVRARIDAVDAEILRLFNERLDLAADVIAAKKQMDKAVFDPGRERDKLSGIARSVARARQHQAIALFSLLMSMNKAEQQRIAGCAAPDALSNRIRCALKPVDAEFPVTATVACQGVEGAYSQIAATKLFQVPKITYFNTFDGVFRAVRDGFCEYGVLPIENSTAGSVNAVYDLLGQYRFTIVRSLRLKIDHNLLARPGTRIEDVKRVYSHEQALAQCEGYLERHGFAPLVCENTALAAERVARSDEGDVAALASRSCANLYGLSVLDADVQDSDNNYTRFVVVSGTPQIFPGANRTSLMLTISHEPGSLYRVLERFFALDINLIKLESRPIPGRDFEFNFYFDLDCPVGSSSFSALVDSLSDVARQCTYFGSYQEVL